MNKYKTIIVDDEFEAREGLKMLVSELPEIDLVAVCGNGVEALDAISMYSIDLMLLDIQMPKITGFDVIRSVPLGRLPEIIITTAYDQFAIKAFEIHALDFLLKPFTDQRFHDAISRATQVINNKQTLNQALKLKSIAESISAKGNEQEMVHSEPGRIIIKEKGIVHLIPHMNIKWIEAFDYYVKIHVDDKVHLLRDTMKNMENRLGKTFMRIHKSAIVNTSLVTWVSKTGKDEYQLQLQDGSYHKISRHFRDSVIKMLPLIS